jgi:hypothetical protein
MVVPMHSFSSYTLDRFLARMQKDFAIVRTETPSILVSKTTLPASPTVVVLPGR